jgi:hypothetical protein
VTVQSNEIAPLVAAMRAGAGIACLPAVAVEDLAEVEPVAPGIVGRMDLFLATHRDLRERARVRSAFDFLTRLFAQKSAALNGASVARLFGGAVEGGQGARPPEPGLTWDGSDL